MNKKTHQAACHRGADNSIARWAEVRASWWEGWVEEGEVWKRWGRCNGGVAVKFLGWQWDPGGAGRGPHHLRHLLTARDWWGRADESGSQCHSPIKYLSPLNCSLPPPAIHLPLLLPFTSPFIITHPLSPCTLSPFKLSSYLVQLMLAFLLSAWHCPPLTARSPFASNNIIPPLTPPHWSVAYCYLSIV